MNNRQKLRDLKTKVANLELEIRALIHKAEADPGIIDAVAADISDFTDEIINTKRELEQMNERKKSISLSTIYNEIKNKI
jgi:hypothetical protein